MKRAGQTKELHLVASLPIIELQGPLKTPLQCGVQLRIVEPSRRCWDVKTGLYTSAYRRSKLQQAPGFVLSLPLRSPQILHVMSGNHRPTSNFVRRSPRKHNLSDLNDSNHVSPKRAKPNTSTTQTWPPALPSSSERTASPYNDPLFCKTERMEFMYSFLLTNTVKQLRQICKPFKVPTSNRSQTQLIANIVMHIHTKSFEDLSIRDLVSTNEHLCHNESWEKDARESRTTLSKLRDVSYFLNLLHRTDRAPAMKSIVRYQGEDKSEFPLTTDPEEPDGVPHFSLNEFARLVVLLRDDEIAKDALRSAYSRTLNRSQFDARVTRDSFWNAIANRFNGHTVDTREDFSGRLDEVDSNKRPLFERSPSVLKKQYEGVRRTVTVVKANWSKSGQNDPTNFVRFLRKTEKNDKLMADSKRAYVFIIVTKLGHQDEAENLFNMTSKLIEEDDSGIEEGFLGDEENNEAFPSSKGRTKSARSSGNAKDLEPLAQYVNRSNQISEEQTEILREHLAIQRENLAGPKNTTEENLQNRYGTRVKLAAWLAESSKSLKVARDLHDDILAEALQAHHQELLEQFKALVSKKDKNASDA